MSGSWWVVVAYRAGHVDVLVESTWPAARRLRDEAMLLFELGGAVQVGVYDDEGGCVFDADRDWVNPPATWSMLAPRRQGRYGWSETAGFALTPETPERFRALL